MACPDCCTERLPDVTPSLGLAAVDARTICTRPISTSSSSAAIWASAVTMPCPISTFPGEIITCPSDENRTHDDSLGFAARLTGNFGAEEGAGLVIGLASRRPPPAPPPPSCYPPHNAKDSGPAPLSLLPP